jgi:two-component system, OmpR family, sensor histidine kinase ArlS
MKLMLRNRLSLYYSVMFSILLGITLGVIYILSAQYRQQEFYQRLKDRTITTFKLLVEVEQIDHDLLQVFDENTINNLYEEKIVLFDSSGNVIYSSIDDTKILYSSDILQQLIKDQADEIEKKEGQYELLGLNFKENGQSYYGIAKAYDRFGRSKLNFLGWILFLVFVISVLLVALLSFYLSKAITVPITMLSRDMEAISPQNLAMRVQEPHTEDEIKFLAQKFNEVLERVEQAFRFQTHFTHHVSHELKTPLAILISNIERIQNERQAGEDTIALNEHFNFQKEGLMEMANIMNALLDISKVESDSKSIVREKLRIDELLFECADTINSQYNQSKFNLSINPAIANESDLEVRGNTRMLKIALTNLLKNAVLYAKTYPVQVHISKEKNSLIINIENDGIQIQPNESILLFTHFFRGSNSSQIKGFGLGLVLVNKIIQLHGGSVIYKPTTSNNRFVLKLPLTISE